MVLSLQHDQRVATCTYIGNAWCHVSEKKLNFLNTDNLNNYNGLLLRVIQSFNEISYFILTWKWFLTDGTPNSS